MGGPDARPRLGAAGARTGRADALVAEAGAGTPALFRIRGGKELALGPLGSPRAQATLNARRPPPLLLRVGPGTVLERVLQLPLAAESRLASVLGYEIDRISPFKADEVALVHEVASRDRAAGRMQVRVALLPRAVLAKTLDGLRAHRLTPVGVLAPRDGGGVWRIGLAAPGADAPSAWRRPVLAAAAACIVLGACAATLPFIVQERALRRVEDRIARLRPEVDQVDALRRRVADRSNGLDAVAAEAARVGDALVVLGTLTTLLPDDTVLTALSLRQRIVTLSGRSASAARLIPLLAADPALRNTSFTAPVTRAEGGADAFAIRAEFGS